VAKKISIAGKHFRKAILYLSIAKNKTKQLEEKKERPEPLLPVLKHAVISAGDLKTIP
jgi:hypothetical protein